MSTQENQHNFFTGTGGLPSSIVSQTYFRLSELATSPATPAREYTEPSGKIRKISAKPAHKGITPLGASTILKWEKLGKFPKAIRTIAGVTVWKATDVCLWLKSLESASNDSEV